MLWLIAGVWLMMLATWATGKLLHRSTALNDGELVAYGSWLILTPTPYDLHRQRWIDTGDLTELWAMVDTLE